MRGDEHTTNYASCSDCGADLGVDDSAQRKPCPVCGSTKRTVSIEAHPVLFGSKLVGHLTQFVDTSSGTAIQATTTALSEISTWVNQSEPLTVKHVIEGHIEPQKAGVPIGPFDDDKVTKILTTIEHHNEQRRARWWSNVEQIRVWVVPILVALISSGIIVTLVLKFLGENQ